MRFAAEYANGFDCYAVCIGHRFPQNLRLLPGLTMSVGTVVPPGKDYELKRWKLRTTRMRKKEIKIKIKRRKDWEKETVYL